MLWFFNKQGGSNWSNLHLVTFFVFKYLYKGGGFLQEYNKSPNKLETGWTPQNWMDSVLFDICSTIRPIGVTSRADPEQQ